VVQASPEGPIGLYARANSPELARSFVTLMASELSEAKLSAIAIAAATPESAEEMARERGARSLARISLSLQDGMLQARGDLLGTWVNFWSGRSRIRAPRPAAVLQGSVPADSQALALASSPASPGADSPHPRGELKLLGATLAALSLAPAAIAAGDLDGDGKDEVVALTDDELVVFSSEGRILVRRDHRGIPPSPTPCREPFGAVAIQARPPRIAYFSANRAHGELLAVDLARSSLRPLQPLNRVPLPFHLWGAFVPGQNTVLPDDLPFRLGRPVSAFSFYPAAPLPGAAKLGAGAKAEATREAWTDALFVFPDGKASWYSASPANDGGEQTLSGLGTASALVDLDGDGRPELATTSPLYSPPADELRVLQARSGAMEPAVRWRGAIPRGRALQMVAAGTGAGNAQQIVIGVWLPDGSGELQVFRTAAP
jgi:hypothetical protein